MASFSKTLPQLLQSTHVVLEARDARLPLTSINPAFESLLNKWYRERGSGMHGPVERIVLYNKADLVPQWGIEPFKRALGRHFTHETLFTTAKLGKSVGALHAKLTDIARRHGDTLPHLNVLVVGMPNVGKSTIINHLRSYGIRGASSSALKTSRLPGMTRATSNKIRLCDDPLIYSVDSPGVMIPFLGHGEASRERAAKISMILGIKESLFDYEHLAAYLLYRLNSMPSSPSTLPPYPPLLRKQTKSREPLGLTESTEAFLDELADRMGYFQSGGVRDRQRAARWFIEWWRSAGGTPEESGSGGEPGVGGSEEWGWGLDCQWADRFEQSQESPLSSITHPEQAASGDHISATEQPETQTLESKFDRLIVRHMKDLETWEEEVSETQMKKREKEEKIQRRAEKGGQAAKKRADTLKRRNRR